jgi:serine/threonine protein kinase
MARKDEVVAPGQVVNRYELGDLIGRGGMGEVYRAWDPRLRREVAIKFLAPVLASDETVRRRFEREATAAARIAHPNVVTIFDTDQLDEDPFIVMECLSGRTLADELREGALPVARVRKIGEQVLAGLRAAHELGVIHRDIQPSNLHIADDGSVKIAYFGIAKSVYALDHTATGQVVGSVVYMAPERVEGRPATYQSDLYSLAVVLYEAVAGDKPFGGETPVAIAHAVLGHEPEPLRERRPEVDDTLADAITRAMAKDPADRFASAAEMEAALASYPSDPSDPTLPLAFDATMVTPTHTIATATQPTSTAEAPLQKPPRQESTRPGRIGAFAHNPRALPVALAVLVVAVALIALFTMRGTPNGVGQPPTLTTNSPGASTGTLPAPTQRPLPRPLEDALQQLEQAVSP